MSFMRVYSWLPVMLAAMLVVSSCAPAAPTSLGTPPQSALSSPTPVTAAPETSRPSVATTPTPVRSTAGVPSPTAVQKKSPRYGGVLRLWAEADPGALDPHQDNTSIRGVALFALAYSGLLMWDPHSPADQKAIPDLAESWNVSGDGLIWTFKLKPGVTFSDGSPLTAADVKFTYDRIMSPPKGVRSAYAGLWKGVQSIDAPDDRTVEIRLAQPKAFLLPLVTWNSSLITPRRVLEADQQALKQKTVGTGPFILKDWKKSVSFTFEKNPNYFKKGLPYLDGIQSIVIPDSSTQFAALRTGKVHMSGYGSRGLSTTEATQLKKEVPDAQVWRYGCGCLGRLLFNVQKKPLNDVRVRQAAALVLDGKLAIDLAYEGVGAVGGFIPVESYWSLPKDELQRAWPVVRGPTADEIARAKKLMADAGYKDGVTTTYMQSSTPTYEEQMLAIKKQLELIGFKVNAIVRQYPAQFNEALAAGAFEVTGQPTVASVLDPDVYLGMYVTSDPQNFGNFSDAQVDDLYKRQSQTVDREQRRQLVWQLQRRLMETVPAVIYVHREFTHAAISQVRNYEGPRPMLYDNLRFEDVWLAQ